jgi:hypothetical protein
LASLATARMWSGLRMLPGFKRRLEVEVGDDGHRGSGHYLGQAFGGLGRVAGDPDDVGPGSAEGVDLGEGAVHIVGLGRRH